MERTIVIAAPVVDATAARWIRDHVLPGALWGQKDEQGWVYDALVASCPCMYGTCHYCKIGDHELCLHRRPGGGHRTASSDACLIGRSRGRYWLADVHDLRKKPCAWLCTCPTCSASAPYTDAADLGLPKPRRATLDGYRQAALF